jgi:pimeloyl-ACP methyl ester carboxylesterase
MMNEEQKNIYGQYPALGKQVAKSFKNATLAELPGIGHIPHIQDLLSFNGRLLQFLRNGK